MATKKGKAAIDRAIAKAKKILAERAKKKKDAATAAKKKRLLASLHKKIKNHKK